jgi:hypothetical protein
MMDRAERGLRVIGNDLQGKAADKAPLDEGTLAASAHVTVDRTPTTITMTLSFDTPYAAAQHEGLNFKHPKKGQAKYLEEPFKQMLPRYESAIAMLMQGF